MNSYLTAIKLTLTLLWAIYDRNDISDKTECLTDFSSVSDH